MLNYLNHKKNPPLCWKIFSQTKKSTILLIDFHIYLFNLVRTDTSLEATPGFEPGIRVLQTRALPLGYVAINFIFNYMHYLINNSIKLKINIGAGNENRTRD